MSTITLYHNPRCSKSRHVLALLEARSVSVEIIEYLKTPPTADELRALLSKLGLNASQLIRKKEQEYKTLSLNGQSEETVLEAMLAHPKLIERPIIIKGNKAVIGRPPENVLSLFEE